MRTSTHCSERSTARAFRAQHSSTFGAQHSSTTTAAQQRSTARAFVAERSTGLRCVNQAVVDARDGRAQARRCDKMDSADPDEERGLPRLEAVDYISGDESSEDGPPALGNDKGGDGEGDLPPIASTAAAVPVLSFGVDVAPGSVGTPAMIFGTQRGALHPHCELIQHLAEAQSRGAVHSHVLIRDCRNPDDG